MSRKSGIPTIDSRASRETMDFALAIARGDLEAIRACPKADLHTHQCAKADRAYVREKTGRDVVPVTTPLGSMDDMHAWVKANIGDLFEGAGGRKLAIAANFVGALKDGSDPYRIRR